MSSTAPSVDGAPDAPDTAATPATGLAGTGLSGVAGAAASAVLPRVVLDSPGAVLLVDLSAGRIVHANALAAQLAPHTGLPVDVETWSADAGLLDREGRALHEQGSTLARVARGEPVTGEAVTAARASRATSAREPLWVVGLPLGDVGQAVGGGAGGPLAHAALVVFLPLRDEAAVASVRAGAEQLTAEAVLASGTSFTISDARLPDRPLVWVNPAFEAVTGYSAATAVGRNCRFLQGPGTDRADVARVREALDAGRGVEQVLLNYRSDGTAFWNALSISPLLDGEGTVTHYVGVQSDVTAAVTAQRELAAAFERVEAARADAEAAHHEAEAARQRAEDARGQAETARERLTLLAEVTGGLSATLDVERAGERLCSMLVPRLADWVVLTLVDQDGRPTSRGTHRDGHAAAMGRWLELREQALTEEGGPLTELLGPRAPRLVTPADVAVVRARSASRAAWAETADLMGTLGMASSMVVPLVARRRVIGTLVMVSGPSGRTYDEEDLSVAVDVAQRASLALDNVRLYAAEHATALTLQRSLLPPVPEVPGLDAAVAYLPGDDRAEVGGDWYDVLALPGGATGLAIGDVMGHDIAAAASMGQLRSVLRSYAWDGDDPATVVDRLDELVQALGMADLATCVYARLDPAPEGGGDGGTGGSRRLVWANAGHHAPLLRHPDGRVEALEEGASVLVGVSAAAQGGRAQAETLIEAGSVLLLFTDGLVEARAQGLEPGLARVAATLAAHDPALGCAALTRALARGLVEHGQDDDVCLLAVRLL